MSSFKLAVVCAVVGTIGSAGLARAEDKHLREWTDIVTFDKPVTEAQCVDAGKKAVAAAGFTAIAIDHSAAGTKTVGATLWIANIDCMQRHTWNAAYISVASDETDKAAFSKIATSLSHAETALGGKSEAGVR
jgi:hypothetical protein